MSQAQAVTIEPDQTTAEITLGGRTLADVMREVEKTFLAYALTQAGGNKTKAAKIADVTPETMRKKCSLYQVRGIFSVA